MRINARLDEPYAGQLNYLAKSRRLAITAIIKQAISLLYNQVASTKSNAAKLLKKTRFIGCGEGPEDLSRNYKHYLKYDHR